MCIRDRNEAAAGKVSSSRRLGFHDAVRFFQQGRNKAQSNGHHHSQFMRRHTDSLKGIQEMFDAIGQYDGRRRIRQER